MEDLELIEERITRESKILTQEEIEIREAEKRANREKELKLREQELRPWVQELFECYNDRDKLYNLFVVWSDLKGFKNEKWFDSISNLIQRGNYKGFINMIKEQWLNSFSDCNKKQRGIKVKRIKYQFEKQPKKLYREKLVNSLSESQRKIEIEITDYGKEQLKIQEEIDKFIFKMNS